MGKHKTSERRQSGFTLIELLVSIAVLLIIAGATVSVILYYQRQYRTLELKRGLEISIRSAIEQMAQDVGQAGLVHSGLTSNTVMSANGTSGYSGTEYYLQTATAVGGSQITITSSSATGKEYLRFYKYERIILDTGGTASTLPCQQEILVVNETPTSNSFAVTTTSGGTMVCAHAAGVNVLQFGVFPEGVLIPQTVNGVSTGSLTPGASSTSLRLVGDIYGTGVKLVVYQCPASGSIAALTRDVYDLMTGAQESHVVVLDNVDNSAGTGCKFTYSYASSDGNAQLVSLTLTDGSIAKFITEVGISIRARSSKKDPLTGDYIYQTRSYLNVLPRNMLNAFMQAVSASSSDTLADTKFQLQALPYSTTAANAILTMGETPNTSGN